MMRDRENKEKGKSREGNEKTLERTELICHVYRTSLSDRLKECNIDSKC